MSWFVVVVVVVVVVVAVFVVLFWGCIGVIIVSIFFMALTFIIQ